MTTIAYASPWVPPEWIVAHGARPHWLRLDGSEGGRPTAPRRGVCPFAHEVVEAVLSGGGASAVVLATTCDQMRYAAALLSEDSPARVFLMNVPSTWQSDVARRLYRDELARLGRFLVGLGGSSPTDDALRSLLLDYQAYRGELTAARARLSSRQFAESLAAVRSASVAFRSAKTALSESAAFAERMATNPRRLALIGGPLVQKDFSLLDLIEQSGGRVVLDGTEGGERTLPAPLDEALLTADPRAAMAAAYFDGIVDVFRRPNRPFYDWLARHVADRGVQGILLRRYVWCDLWHAELQRIKEAAGVPVLEVDVDGDDGGTLARTTGRLEAFLEMLR